VVDAVIVAYERMIGSFNYSGGGTYSLTVNMSTSGSGFGAGANLNTVLGGKPKSGTITMGAGNGSSDVNDTNGWFMDPTPFESSEFLGNITNAFSGDAQAGSPAAGKGDFYTVVAAEMTHCMGLFGGTGVMPGWDSKTTNTGIPDTAEAGGGNAGTKGYFYTFVGPSIKHLLTSNNGGSGTGGSDFMAAVHAAGPGVNVSFGGDTYTGAQDQGNAVYENGRRYSINQAFALMFKDAYNYSTVNPAKWGTFYSTLNETTKNVTVRGGSGTNNDTISITRSGNTISVSVDPAMTPSPSRRTSACRSRSMPPPGPTASPSPAPAATTRSAWPTARSPARPPSATPTSRALPSKATTATTRSTSTAPA